jgi:hypothetical protein
LILNWSGIELLNSAESRISWIVNLRHQSKFRMFACFFLTRIFFLVLSFNVYIISYYALFFLLSSFYRIFFVNFQTDPSYLGSFYLFLFLEFTLTNYFNWYLFSDFILQHYICWEWILFFSSIFQSWGFFILDFINFF